jgi:hypothetical protein
MYHVKEIPNPPPGGLDLNIADEEEFSPDKLRSNIERLYMTIVSSEIGDPLQATHIPVGNQHDELRKAHRSITVLARNATHCLVLRGVLCGMGPRPHYAPCGRHVDHTDHVPTCSSSHVPARTDSIGLQ